MGDKGTRESGDDGLEVVTHLASALLHVRDRDEALATALDVLHERLGSTVAVAWGVDPAEQWRLLATRGPQALVDAALAHAPVPTRSSGEVLESTSASNEFHVGVGTPRGGRVAALWLTGLPEHRDVNDLARLGRAVGSLLDGVCERLGRLWLADRAQQAAGIGSFEWRADLDQVWLSDQMYRNLGTHAGGFEHTLVGYLARVHPEDREALMAQVETARREGGGWYTLHRMVADDGEPRWIEGRGRVEVDDHGVTIRIVGTGQDVTHRRELEHQLAERGERDELTGLANRYGFERRLAGALEDGREGRVVVAAMVDIEDFRSVNAQLGWRAGDQLLQSVADRLRELEEAQAVARLAADEFALLFTVDRHAGSVERLGETIAAHLTGASPSRQGTRPVEVAVGLATNVDDGTSPDELLRSASVALQVAKSRTNARWLVFDPDKHEQALRRLAMEADLRRAIDEGDIEVAYQPILSLRTGRITGVEALARWQRPGHGPVSPATFVPIAERAGLIARLGEQVLETACRQLRDWEQRWPHAEGLRVGVNLSAAQLDDAAVVEHVEEILARVGLAPDRLVLEVTETTISHDLPGALARLYELRRRGIRVAIDDFGTGYSSLARLREIPFDILKIDRSFIKDIAGRHEPTPILQALFSISRSLDLDVVAEGIETPVQLAVMLGHDCNFAQGFLFSRPRTPEDLEALLADDPCWDPAVIAGEVPAPRTSPRLQQLLDELTGPEAVPSRQVLDEVLALLADLTGLDSVYLTSIDFRRDVQEILVSHNRGVLHIGEGLQVPWTATLCRRALTAGTPVIADVQREYPDALVARDLDIGTYVGVEVHGDKGGLRGTLCGVTSAVAPVPQETVETLQWVARLLADTVQEAGGGRRASS